MTGCQQNYHDCGNLCNSQHSTYTIVGKFYFGCQIQQIHVTTPLNELHHHWFFDLEIWISHSWLDVNYNKNRHTDVLVITSCKVNALLKINVRGNIRSVMMEYYFQYLFLKANLVHTSPYIFILFIFRYSPCQQSFSPCSSYWDDNTRWRTCQTPHMQCKPNGKKTS